MIEAKIFEAKNLEEAIKKACDYFKREKEELEITVLEPGSSGFLGIRAKNSVIEVKPKVIGDDDLKEFIQDVIKKIVSYISSDPKVNVIKSNDRINVKLDVGNDIGLVIGKDRQNLNALEFIINLIVGKKIMEKVNIKLEIIGGDKKVQRREFRTTKFVKRQSYSPTGRKGYSSSRRSINRNNKSRDLNTFKERG